jgi:putative ABC transport system ATP-binding protein
MADMMITATGIRRGFPAPHQKDSIFWALNGVDIAVPANQLTMLRGRSGSGKTTLMNILSLLDDPTEGEVTIEGKSAKNLSPKEKDALRRTDVGFVFQSVALIPMMTVYENVEFALRLAGYQGDRKKRVEECLRLVGLLARSSHMPQELSGGEQQRVAIARAIAHRPKILFADEPTAELDTNTALTVMKTFRALIESEQVAILMTTHDSGLMPLADQIYHLEEGVLVNDDN